MVICLRMGKNLIAETPPGDFQVTTLETPLLSQQAITSKGIPSTLPTYSWTLTPIPNWTCSVVTIPPFDARLPSTWLTNCADPSTRLQNTNLKRLLAAKFFSSSTQRRSGRCLVTKPYGANTQKLLLEKRDELGQELCLQSQFEWTEFAQCLCNLCTVWRLLKHSFYMSKVRRKEDS